MRLAIIGCGLIGSKRAAAAKGHDIVAVCDPDAERRDPLARATSARAFADWRDALAVEADAVIVATPHDRLARIALAAVEAGRLLSEPDGSRSTAFT